MSAALLSSDTRAQDAAVELKAGAPDAAAQPQDAPAPQQAEPPTAKATSDGDPFVDPVSPQGQTARGLYLSGPTVRYLGADGIISRLRRARVDAAVIDLKDGRGQVTYDTNIEALEPQQVRYLGDGRELIRKLKEAGIYTIARIVCFSDPKLPRNEPHRAVMDKRPHREGQLWAKWEGRNTWLDPYNTDNHDVVLGLAKEAEALGFDEIQFDYFRFPVDEAAPNAKFPAETDQPRHLVLRDLLRRVDEGVRIPIGIDVFGVAAFRWQPPQEKTGLGQILGEWTDYVEVFSPMLYVNGMTAWMKHVDKGRAERLVRAGVNRVRARLGPEPVIRPFLQGFERGADYYNPTFIAEQIRGARSAGADGFLFWHPGCRYSMVRRAMNGAARMLGRPFPIERRADWRMQVWEARRDGREGPAYAAAEQQHPNGAPEDDGSTTKSVEEEPARSEDASSSPDPEEE